MAVVGKKTRKRIEEQWHMRTGGKRRLGKSERVQLPTGNGKQTKREKRGKGRGARKSRMRVNERTTARKRERRKERKTTERKG